MVQVREALAIDMSHLADRCGSPEWEAIANPDNRLRERTAAQLKDTSSTILGELDDLAVLVLFSVFEATVRTRAEAEVNREMERISHAAVLEAVRDLKDAIANGSFAKVTRAFKRMDTDLTTQIDQIRKFRNWVAHGRRDAPENRTKPDDAFDRLGRYLKLLTESSNPGDEPPPQPASSEPPSEA